MRLLYTRIYLHMLGMLAVVAVITITVFSTGFRTAVFRNFTERLVQHEAAVLADRFEQPEALRRVSQRLSADLEVDITLRDRAGRTLVSAGNEELPPLTDEERETTRKGATSFSHRRRGWYAVAPVVDPASGAMLGTVQAAPLRKARPPNMVRPALTLALVLLVVAAASAPLARRISRPVERLTEAMRRFGEGDLGYRVQLPFRHWFHRHGRRPPDELAQLTASWNEMAERIQHLVLGQKELLANVSHELRSPLSRIRLALELLPRDEGTEARIRDLESDLGELERLIDDVLTASRLEATGLPTRLGTVDVKGLLTQLGDRAHVDPATERLEVRVDEVPGKAAPETIEADGALLKRALWNLVENAAKYGAPPIVLSAFADGDQLHLRVSDAGAGIAAEDRARVFEPFYRADKARTPGRAAGFGLGMTIARRVAEVHGGRIEVADARTDGDGRRSGCAVTLVLPLAPAPTRGPGKLG